MVNTKKPRKMFFKECNVKAKEESSEEEDDMDITQEESDKTQQSSDKEEMDLHLDFDELGILDEWGEDDDMDRQKE